MKKLLHFLANPFVLPILPTIILILFLPFRYDRYVLELDQTKKLPLDTYEWYDDLTLDGNSERIYMRDNGNFTWVAIYDPNENLYNQWNLLGNVNFSGMVKMGISGDYDSNGLKEVYLFTIKNDSIFLHSIVDLQDPTLAISDRFISKVGPGKGKPDPRFIPAEMDDLDGDGQKELIFGLCGGFSLFPRNVFAYYIQKDSLVRSPESFYHITAISQADFTGDGKKEIILSGMASSNVAPARAKYHDHSNWAMVLDQNLEFVFEPVDLKGKSNAFLPLFIDPDGNGELISVVTSGHTNENGKIFFISRDGEVVKTTDAEMKVGISFSFYDRKERPLLLLSDPLTGTFVFDYSSNSLTPFSKSFISFLQFYDFEGDGRQEVITFSYNQSEMHVFREGLRNGAKLGINWSGSVPRLFSIKESTTEPPQISLQLGQDHYLLNYGPNPAYYLNFLYFLLIYLGMIGFAVATRRIQQRQFQRRLDTEKKITELQLSLVKNQLDPHFTMNAINSIIHSVNQNETEKANDNLHRFSRLYRSLLLSADKPLRSLREELDFCRDYLELEKARFGDAFDFSFRVDKEVDIDQQIPKMIIQTHAENAVKHGLSRKERDGMLDIEIKPLPEGLEISISDNGIGRRQAAENKTASTGKGLAIMKEFYNLYKKYYKKDISADIQDVFDEEGKPLGTRVTIKISRDEESH